MGHAGLTFPCLHHPCTLSPVPRLTLTATPRKTTEEGKIHSYLINLCPGKDAHKHKNTCGQKKCTQPQRSQYPAPVPRLCACMVFHQRVTQFIQCLDKPLADHFPNIEKQTKSVCIKLLFMFNIMNNFGSVECMLMVGIFGSL